MPFTLSDIKKSACAPLNQAVIAGLEKANKKKSKYNSVKMEITLQDGTITLADSKKEACRWNDLKFLESIGEISQLRRQVVYDLGVCKYVADHVYRDKTGAEVTEDVKSDMTRKLPVYRLKKKLMKERFGIDIKEF